MHIKYILSFKKERAVPNDFIVIKATAPYICDYYAI
jgi:hypothetical protein